LHHEVTREILALKKFERARDRLAEEIARENITGFFGLPSGYQDIVRGDDRFIISLRVINPKAESMKDIRSLFYETKVSGHPQAFRSEVVKLASTILEMSVTPDLALILQVFVRTKYVFNEEKTRSQTAVVEVKRGKAQLSSDQRKDVELSRTRNIPYYLLNVDDSDCIHGKYILKLVPQVPSLLLSIHELATT
jgi:hypothetical protein